MPPALISIATGFCSSGYAIVAAASRGSWSRLSRASARQLGALPSNLLRQFTFPIAATVLIPTRQRLGALPPFVGGGWGGGPEIGAPMLPNAL